ncbi:MAG: type I 3-dehydroquinate dehydratase [Luteolibacter sp.]|uniref:type I 3-dehydroquinate dehydratase n=1 Tax=Luteolibacter sp. TaxID=1962973 RepID=UPI0032636AEC
MALVKFEMNGGSAKIVGSFGSASDLRDSQLAEVRKACDIAEIRLDLLIAECGKIHPALWAHLLDFPLLFTARRSEEGGAGALDADTRTKLLMDVLDDASLIDIEVASIPEMTTILHELRSRKIPWVASCHDFEKLPDLAVLREAEARANESGATIFKAAAMLSSPADLTRLADFQMASHALPVSTMGMGPLAPVSRLLCAQTGSVLNYGYLGTKATAPGQWDSRLLKTAISRLTPFKR